MARTPSFNFGALAKPRKNKGAKKTGKAKGRGSKGGNAWRQYVGVSNSPIPD